MSGDNFINFNINTMTIVELTEYGKKILYDNPYVYNKTTEKNGHTYYKSHLWEIMRIFGKSMYMGCPDVPFVNNEIKICENW